MPVANLTARKVESLKPPPTGQIDFWDVSLKNFGVRVSASGRKTWSVYYRFHRRKRRFNLGTFPAVSLADARDRARAALSKVAAGQDPAAEKFLIREAATFEDLTTEYIERYAKKKKRSWQNDKWMINRHLLPRWRHVKARDVSRSDVRALVETIADNGAPILANRVLALVSKIFNFSIQREWRPDNPCKGLDRPGVERSRERVLTDEEIKKLWDALEDEDPFFRALFRLRLLTAQRGGEIRRMKWSDIDLMTGEWLIPGADAKNGVTHHVPLNTDARSLLTELKAWQHERLREINEGRKKKKWELKEPSEWVFPSPRGDGPFEWEQRATARIREKSGVDFRPHDIRRTVGTLMTKYGYADRFIVKRILNHVDRDITAVYDRNRYDVQKRAALNSWGRRLQSIVEGKEASAKVVQMSKTPK